MQQLAPAKRKRSDQEDELHSAWGDQLECDFWNIHRKPMVLKCAKGVECIECLDCKLTFCSEFCYKNHVCHRTSLDFDDCYKNPSILVQWIFERLDACVVNLEESNLFREAIGINTVKSTHDLCKLFKTNDENFTKRAVTYWSALKSGPRTFQELVELNCQCGFEYSNNIQQLVLSGRSKFSKFVCDKICTVIMNTPHLHSVLSKVGSSKDLLRLFLVVMRQGFR